MDLSGRWFPINCVVAAATLRSRFCLYIRRHVVLERVPSAVIPPPQIGILVSVVASSWSRLNPLFPPRVSTDEPPAALDSFSSASIKGICSRIQRSRILWLSRFSFAISWLLVFSSSNPLAQRLVRRRCVLAGKPKQLCVNLVKIDLT